MPRKAKEEIKEAKTTIVKKASNRKKAVDLVEKKKRKTNKASASTTKLKKTLNRKTPSKKSNKVSKKEPMKPKQKTSKIAEKKTNKKLVTAKVSTKKRISKKTQPKMEVAEYYDLPYRYNQTIVKILAQTPTTLFVYWDVSDEDRKKYIEQYGPYFFHDTKPVLVVHNKTKNYDFEVDINDFANSWYLHLVDSNCEYEIELGRRPINEYAKIENFLPIAQSNLMQSPNDHILLDRLSHVVYFKNIKTNEIKSKTTLSLLSKIGKLSSLAECYQKLYPEEEINFAKLHLRNPSSSSSFK